MEVKYNLQHEIWVGEEEKFAKEIADGRQKLEKLNVQVRVGVGGVGGDDHEDATYIANSEESNLAR